MRVGVPKETAQGERRVALVPDAITRLSGFEVLVEPGAEIVHEGVTIVGLTNLASTMPNHASQLYARNVSALLQHLAPSGELALDWTDEITAGTCVTRREEVAA